MHILTQFKQNADSDNVVSTCTRKGEAVMMDFNAGAIVPSTIDRLLEKGQKLVSDNNLPQALVLANKCVEQDGKHPEVWAFLGEVKLAVG
jgi:hypothetical protein